MLSWPVYRLLFFISSFSVSPKLVVLRIWVQPPFSSHLMHPLAEFILTWGHLHPATASLLGVLCDSSGPTTALQGHCLCQHTQQCTISSFSSSSQSRPSSLVPYFGSGHRQWPAIQAKETLTQLESMVAQKFIFYTHKNEHSVLSNKDIC
jgi:hypothetical protein